MKDICLRLRITYQKMLGTQCGNNHCHLCMQEQKIQEKEDLKEMVVEKETEQEFYKIASRKHDNEENTYQMETKLTSSIKEVYEYNNTMSENARKTRHMI